MTKPDASETRALRCDDCGPIEYALLDGYGFGDRLLEGVKFRVELVNGKVKVTTDPEHADYMKDLNERKWLREATSFAEQEDTLECPKCGQDVDGPGVL